MGQKQFNYDEIFTLFSFPFVLTRKLNHRAKILQSCRAIYHIFQR